LKKKEPTKQRFDLKKNAFILKGLRQNMQNPLNQPAANPDALVL
jgi:hypothetical protein